MGIARTEFIFKNELGEHKISISGIPRIEEYGVLVHGYREADIFYTMDKIISLELIDENGKVVKKIK